METRIQDKFLSPTTSKVGLCSAPRGIGSLGVFIRGHMKLLLLILTGCISSHGITVVQKPFTETGANQNGTEARLHTGGLLYFKVGKNNRKATQANHDKAWKIAEKNCSPNHANVIDDRWIDGETTQKELVKTEKRLAIEYSCL